MNKLIEIRKLLCRAALLCLVSVAGGALLQGCTHDKELLGCPEGAPGTLTLKFNVPGAQSNGGATRAVLPAENVVTDIAVWLLNDADVCTYYRHIKAGAGQPADQDWTSGDFNVSLPNVPELATVHRMFIVANAEDNLEGWGMGLTDQVDTTLEQLRYVLTTKASSETNIIESPLAMGYFWEANPGDVTGGVISSPHSVSLGRTVARVNVTVKVDETHSPGLAAKLQLDKAMVTLKNLVEHGCALFQPETATGFEHTGRPTDNYHYRLNYVTPPANNHPYTAIPVGFYAQSQPLTVTADVGVTSPFYINQRSEYTYKDANAEKKVSVLLQVPYVDGGVENEDNYYKVEIYNTDIQPEDKKYDIYPNRSYNLTLTIVGLGNESVKTVIDCLPWNVEDQDLDAGKSFTLSNEEFVAYADAGVESTAVTISAFGKTPGEVTPSTGITITQGAAFPAYSAGTDVKIKFDAGTDTGTLTIKQDGASKTVKVTRKPIITSIGEDFNQFAGSEYTSVHCIDASGFRISQSPTDYDGASELTPGATITSDSGGFYFYASRGFSFISKPADATATLDIISTLTDGTQKKERVFLHREGATPSNLSHLYMGTFHRNDQTGERVIQQWGSKYNGEWSAIVLEGADWIRLDPGIRSGFPYNDQNAEANQLPAEATSEISKRTGEIKFRLGLTSVNPATPSSDYPTGKPRYGLVLVAYKESGVNKYHPIFVRQGEDADYVFSSADGYASGYGGTLTNRPRARKVAPFALKKNSNQNNTSASGNRNHSFLKYPTQIGALFRTDLARSVHPGVRPYNLNSNNQKEMIGGGLLPIGDFYTNNYHLNEPCPTGYTKIQDYDVDDTPFRTNYTIHDNLKFSTLRQSLYYKPKPTGNIQKETFVDDNLPVGSLYADGYFDRVNLFRTQYALGYSTSDELNNIDFAASGTVFFHPTTYRHVFLPGNGLSYYDASNTYDGKDMRQVGAPVLYVGIAHHPNTRYFWYFYEAHSGNTYGTMESGGGYGSQLWIDANNGAYSMSVFSIRCVKN